MSLLNYVVGGKGTYRGHLVAAGIILSMLKLLVPKVTRP